MCLYPIRFQARGQVWIDAVVNSSTHLQAEAVLAKRRLRQHVHTPDDGMCPGFQLTGAPCDFGSAAVTEVFHVLVLVNGRGKRGIDAALDSQPRIGEIGHRSISAHARRVKKWRAKSYQRNPERQLPAEVVAAAIYKFRL